MKKHGGKRAHAGRPKIPESEKRVTTTICMPGKMLRQLDEIDGDRSANVRAALKSYYDFSE